MKILQWLKEIIMLYLSQHARNKEMMAKGLVKDIARRLQTLRKERGYNPTDILRCCINS